ncbi:MAG: DNA mismatch repair endonuclease MutL [Bacteroidia bacterium]
MSSVIKLLSDAVANQIAAGEVVQRPASAIKELLENSLDAGASKIQVLIKDGGSTLMQVIDNGKGMSETDVRLCWERHATSKIQKAEDLFHLNTYGFRGEAMASIAAVAQVEMKSRRAEDEVAQYIRIEGSEVLEQRADAAPVGTNISIKNLFYNIPARRNFLKSIAVETKHIVEEFLRQAMANPQVEFVYHNNGQLVYHFKSQSPKERVMETLGKKQGNELLSVEEDTDIVQIQGFVGAPGWAKRTRGEQYFFMNGRFIRSSYFHHAVASAYEGLIESDAHPTYALYLRVHPGKVDVNVHPTKTEVKFEDEKHIYNLIKAAVRKSLGSFVVQPNLDLGDFDHLDAFLRQPIAPRSGATPPPRQNRPPPSTEKRNPAYNPFGDNGGGYQRNSHQDWQKVLGSVEITQSRSSSQNTPNAEIFGPVSPNLSPEKDVVAGIFPLGENYLVANVNGQLWVVDKKRTQQHIYYHEYLQQLQAQSGLSQQLLFPRTIELPPAQIPLVLDLMQELQWLGFDLSHFGGNTLIVNGVPAILSQGDEQKLIENLLEDYQNTQGDVKLGKYESMALSMARHAAQRNPVMQTSEELQSLMQRMLSLPDYHTTLNGKTLYIEISANQLFERFQNQKFKS